MAELRLIVGLGNPGTQYESTRHNIGFMLLDELAREAGPSGWRERDRALLTEVMIEGRRLTLLKPQTFMNLSGEAVAPFARFNRIAAEEILVVHDEIDLEAGSLRIKEGGGDGGHNGLKSLQAHLGSGSFVRLRLGIGRPGEVPGRDRREEVSSWVLSRFSREERPGVDEQLRRGRDAVIDLIRSGVREAQNRWNRQDPRNV